MSEALLLFVAIAMSTFGLMFAGVNIVRDNLVPGLFCMLAGSVGNGLIVYAAMGMVS